MGIEEDEPFPFASPPPKLAMAVGMGGGTNEEREDGARRMGEEEVKWWAGQMIAAIEWVHGQGYAHR